MVSHGDGYDGPRYLHDLEISPNWLKYTDLAGHEWKLSDANYWWLHYGKLWCRAENLSAREINGVSIPPVILRENPGWLAPKNVTTYETYLPTSATPYCVCNYCGGSSNVTIHVHGSTTVDHHAGPPTPAPAAPNIPSDFVDLPPGPDCCRECRLDDGPLYVGGLCRYCWMLHTLPNPITNPVAKSHPDTLDWDRALQYTAFLAPLISIIITILIILVVLAK